MVAPPVKTLYIEVVKSLILDPVAFSVAKARLLVRSNAELARRTGSNLETVRYYEKVGLLPEPHAP